CFRGARKQRQVHKAINGPYPAGSWACNPALKRSGEDKNSLDLFDLAFADSQIKQAADQGERDIRLTLKYPTGDTQVEKAVADLCNQMKTIGITLVPEARDPRDLRADVEETRSYDLAYYHYDFS